MTIRPRSAALWGGSLMLGCALGACSVLGDLDQFQAGTAASTVSAGGAGGATTTSTSTQGGGGATSTTTTAGGAGGTGGAGGRGGSGGEGGTDPCAGAGAVSYAVTGTIAPVRNACEMFESIQGTVLPNAAEAEAPLDLGGSMPFPFCFYGKPVEHLWVGDNGYLAFTENAPNGLITATGAPHSLGEQTDKPAPAVLPFWDDLRTSDGGVCFAVTPADESPHRVMWITWDRACFSAGSDCEALGNSFLTFTIGLEETTNRIYVGYPQMVGSAGLQENLNGSAATIGVTDDVPAACTADDCNALGLCSNGSPCNYTEFSSNAIIPGGIPRLLFEPQPVPAGN